MPSCLEAAPRSIGILALTALLGVRLAHAQAPPRVDPSPERVAALRLLESEVEGFLARARTYQDALHALVNRRRATQLDAVRRRFQRQIAAEREAEAQSRRHAIDVFVRFLERYPDDPEHTPDVMLRLAELYYDDAAYAKLAADERLDAVREARESRGLATDDLTADPLDQRCAVLLFRHVASRFDSYRMRDAAHYLLAWTLNEMGFADESAAAYRALACPDASPYAPRLDLALPLAPGGAPLACPRLDALLRPLAPELLTPTHSPAPTNTPVYEACAPMRGPSGQVSRYAAEAFYHLGDHHFERALHADGARENTLAAAAYRASMRESESPRRPTDPAPPANLPRLAELDPARRYGPYWPLALYRLGWTHFSIPGGHAPALRAFTRLLDYYDYVATSDPTRTGSRNDTLRWVGVILAEHGWDSSDDERETARCQPLIERIATPPLDATRPFDCTGIARVTRADLVHQDRAWTPDAYLALADAYFAQTRYYESVALYRLYLERFGLHHGVPRASAQVALAYDRQRQYDQAREARLGSVPVFTRWAEAHRDDPAAVRAGDQLLLDGLRQAAVQTHQHAQESRLRAEALARESRVVPAREASSQADALYLRAAEAYTALVERDPHDERAGEYRFSRAEALFFARRYAEAARAFAEVRDARDDDHFVAPAALMAVRALEARVIAGVQATTLDPCSAVRAGLAPEVLVHPETRLPLIDATRAQSCASPASTSQPVPDAVRALIDARDAYVVRAGARSEFGARFAYQNALAELRFGLREAGERRLRALLVAHCDDADIAPRGYASLSNLLLETGRSEDRESLALEQSRRTCAGVGAAGVREVLTDGRLRRAEGALEEADRAHGPDARARVERAASELLTVARENATHREAPLALLRAGLSLDRAGLGGDAARVYEALLARYGGARETEYTRLLASLDEARHRAALANERTLSLEAAVAHYEALLVEPRTARAEGHDARTRDALIALATLRTQLGQHERARAAYTALAARVGTPRERAEALFHAAEAPLRAGDTRGAVTALRAFRADVALDAQTGESHVRAQHRLAEALTRQGDTAGARAALVEVPRLFRTLGLAPGSATATLAAEAQRSEVDARVAVFTRSALTVGTAEEVSAQLQRLAREADAIDTLAVEAVNLGGAEHSIVSLARAGASREHLASLLERAATSVRLSAAQERALARALTAATRLDRAAQGVEARDPALAARLRGRAEQVREQVEAARAAQGAAVQRQFDALAATQRRSALRAYALAVHLAREGRVVSPVVAGSRERLRAEDNAAHLEQALREMPEGLARATRFHYEPGMFDAGTAGETRAESAQSASPSLARE